ncbi:hypothetical protein [Pedobacter sp. UC225_65]|uniref:hypothetical protein n=1 Tax=Pedobacter sp. UC225_65 TaxID=3350173 RepID=UPI00366C7070
MPERKLDETIARLKPMLNDPNLENNVAKAAAKTAPPQQMNTMANEDANMMQEGANKPKGNITPTQKVGTNTMLAQVIGVIIGSPEFQRK